jgi:hypothetical protein
MSVFHLWNPNVSPEQPEALEFVITRGDAYDIAKGTRRFFVEAAHALGVPGEIRSWSVRACRSKYYTDYLGEFDWRDNWQPVWKATLVMAQPVGILPHNASPWIGLDAFDDSWHSGARRMAHKVACLVVADFANAAARSKAQRIIQADSMAKALQARHRLPDPEFGTSSVVGKFSQLQVDLGQVRETFFANGADYAEHVMGLCRKSKGTVHFAARKFL